MVSRNLIELQRNGRILLLSMLTASLIMFSRTGKVRLASNILSCVFLGLVLTSASGKDMQKFFVEKKIRVTVLEGGIVAEVEFRNLSNEEIYIRKGSAAVFVFFEGEQLEYKGPLISRNDYALSDYEKLKPGDKTVRRKMLEKEHIFLPGTHTYRVMTPGGYFDPVKKVNFEAPPVQTEVTFSF